MMKFYTFRRIIYLFLVVGIVLTSCSNPTSVVTPSQVTTTANNADEYIRPDESIRNLQDPQVSTTKIPQALATGESYLDAWRDEDYERMYSFLSEESKVGISFDDFKKKHLTIAEESALNELRYGITGNEMLGNGQAVIRYHLALDSNLFGPIERDTRMDLLLEQGQWKINFDEAMILPELAGGKTLRVDIEPPERAAIYDRNGNLLAGQANATAIGLNPDYVDPENSEGLFGLLARASGLTISEIVRRVENANPGDYLPLGQLETNKASNLIQALSSWGAVVISNYSARYYPGNGIAPHLVGYVRAIGQEELTDFRRLGYRIDEKVGRKGIELWGEDLLSGERGGTLYVLDEKGLPVDQLGSTPSEPGSAIYSTIDQEFQLEVQEALRGFRGAAVVLEKDTGRVLAFASSPGFDPNAFQTENYNWITTLSGVVNDANLPEFNRASQGLYPLGSVFKIITMAAALESGLYTPEYTYDCQYFFTEVAGLTLNDWTYDRFLEDGETKPSGLLNLTEGLMRSCNPFFWHLGRGLFLADKPNAISDMARGFGLGEKTGIDVVDEEAGNIPNPATEVDAVNIAIGQGDVQVTPLQVARFIAAIGNGGTLYRPQAIEKIVAPDGTTQFEFKPEETGKLPISPENLAAIQEGMQGVISSRSPRGTALDVFGGFRIPIAGKTGTATSQTNDPHSWFAGYSNAGRTDKPDIAIAVLTENAGEGSEISAPIFRRIMELYFFGQPQRIYPWEASIGITKTPTPLFYETPTPEEFVEP